MAGVGGQNQPPSLDGPMAKVKRADVHYSNVVGAWRDICETSPQAYSIEIGDNGRKHSHRATVFPVVDPEWGLVLGDAVHNLRSALDHLAWQLVLANGGSPVDGPGGTQFPIRKPPASTVTIAGGVDPDALRLIDDIQPYRGGDDGKNLALINDLDIMDKHHFVIVTAMVAGGWATIVGMGGSLDLPMSSHDATIPNIIDRGRPDPTQGVKVGDVVAWFVYDAPLHHADPNFDLLPDVTFIEGPLAGESFLEIGVLLRWLRDDLLPRFARFF
jgi:hypothetical protein